MLTVAWKTHLSNFELLVTTPKCFWVCIFLAGRVDNMFADGGRGDSFISPAGSASCLLLLTSFYPDFAYEIQHDIVI